MPVRIVFEGLMLFQFPESGPNAGKLVAYLINAADFAGGSPGHPHDHDAEILILTGAESGSGLVSKTLKRLATLDIVVPGPKGASPSPSFTRHVPDLDAIIEHATPAIRKAANGPANGALIQNIVTVDRGIVRVTDVAVWDQGGYPLSGDPAEIGQRATSPVVLKFMDSSVRGHMASKVVVEIDDAETVELECDHDNRFNGRKKGSANPTDSHMPARTVEIRITNYELPEDKPTPWGLDFQWLFEAAGYGAADLSGPEFTAWVEAGHAYDRDLFDAEREMFLGGTLHTIGRPFPYIESADSLTTLQPLTNHPPKVLVCLLAVSYLKTVVKPDGTVERTEVKFEIPLRPSRKAPTKPKRPAKKTTATAKKEAKSTTRKR